MKKILFVLLIPALILLLFMHPDVIASGCSHGLHLWYTAVLPSLLPFMIASGLLIRTGLFRYLNPVYAPLLKKLFQISEDGCYAVLLGFLCGFPMGAKVIADLVREKHISAEEGSYLLGFCNNVSPAFFFNYVCLLKLGYPSVPWKLVLLFYSLPVLYGLASRPFYHFPQTGRTQKQASVHRMDFPMLDACIMDGFSTITRLGGYIMLFTIFVHFLKLLPLSGLLPALISSFLEISCGIDQLSEAVAVPVWRTALVCVCAAFGGLCICAQTQSVLTGTPLSVRTWLRGRITIALVLLLLLLSFPPAVTEAAASALPGYW